MEDPKSTDEQPSSTDARVREAYHDKAVNIDFTVAKQQEDDALKGKSTSGS